MEPMGGCGPSDLGIDGISGAVEIGAGGFGTVYRARQDGIGREVAVKVLRAPARNDGARRRFEHECRALGRLSGHPNIVVVHAAGVSASGLPFLVMEHLPGGSLAERLAQDGPMPWPDVADIGVKLADALAAAHAEGVLHRDLKPENMLISRYGEPQLVDFGVALVEGTTITRPGPVAYSLAHAAPEVVDGDAATEAADVYSLASSLYALLAGHAPFVREGEGTYHALVARVLADEPPDLRPSGLPEAFWDVLAAALAKDPSERTTGAPVLASQLRSLVPDQHQALGPAAGVGDEEGPTSVGREPGHDTVLARRRGPVTAVAPVARSSAWSGPRRWAIVAAAVAVLGAVGAVVLSRAEERPRVTERAAALMVPTTSTSTTSSTDPGSSPATAPPAGAAGGPAQQPAGSSGAVERTPASPAVVTVAKPPVPRTVPPLTAAPTRTATGPSPTPDVVQLTPPPNGEVPEWWCFTGSATLQAGRALVLGVQNLSDPANKVYFETVDQWDGAPGRGPWSRSQFFGSGDTSVGQPFVVYVIVLSEADRQAAIASAIETNGSAWKAQELPAGGQLKQTLGLDRIAGPGTCPI